MTEEVERSAGFVLFREIGDTVQYLLLQDASPPNYWSPPQGFVKPREDEYVAALKATEKATGIQVEQLAVYEDCCETLSSQIPKRSDSSTIITKRAKYWLVVAKTGEATYSTEYQNAIWATLDEVLRIFSDFPDLQNLFKNFHNYLTH